MFHYTIFEVCGWYLSRLWNSISGIQNVSIGKKKLMIVLNLMSISFIGNRSLSFKNTVVILCYEGDALVAVITGHLYYVKFIKTSSAIEIKHKHFFQSFENSVHLVSWLLS